jgi:hypothetical protein
MPYVTDLLQSIGNGSSILVYRSLRTAAGTYAFESSVLFRTVLTTELSVNVLKRERVRQLLMCYPLLYR